MFIKGLDWKAHYIKERAFNTVNANVANPFLDAVSPGFVVRTVMIQVVVNFFFIQLLKPHIC